MLFYSSNAEWIADPTHMDSKYHQAKTVDEDFHDYLEFGDFRKYYMVYCTFIVETPHGELEMKCISGDSIHRCMGGLPIAIQRQHDSGCRVINLSENPEALALAQTGEIKYW